MELSFWQANEQYTIDTNMNKIRFYGDKSFEESKIGWHIGNNSKWVLLI